MKKRLIIILLIAGSILLILALALLFNSNKYKNNSKLEIIDATYMCNDSAETFYEDDEYIYYFPCVKSKSVYVKFKNGNKILVVDALEEKKVTINELIKAGLTVYKKEK